MPIQFNTTIDAYATGARAAEQAYGVNYGDIRDGIPGHAERTGLLAGPLAGAVRIGNFDPSTGSGFSGFNMPDGLLYRYYKAFGAGLMSPDGLSPEDFTFETFPADSIHTADTGGSGADPSSVADFLDTIDFMATDWQPGSDHASPAGHETAPVLPAPSIIRRNSRECSPWHHEQRRGVQESPCTEGGGFAGSGAGGARTGSVGGAVFGAGGGGGSNGNNGNNGNVIGDTNGIGGVPGAGGGGSPGNGGSQPGYPGCAAYPCNSEGGGSGNDGGGGAASGNPSGIGGDDGGGPGGGIPAEVRTVPEPAPFALLMLGFASMYAVRSRKMLFSAAVAAKRRIR